MYKKFTLFALLTVCACLLYACKKDSKPKSNSELIVGKWLATKEHIKIYTSNGTLMKDTIFIFANDPINLARYAIFNENKSAYITIGTTINTTSRITYSISDKNLMMYEAGNYSYTSSIMMLNATNMELEDSSTDDHADSQGNVNTYKLVGDTYYIKQ